MQSKNGLILQFNSIFYAAVAMSTTIKNNVAKNTLYCQMKS